MAIFKRMQWIARANIHHWLDQLEDPIQQLGEYAKELEQAIRQTKAVLAQQFAAEEKQMVLIQETKIMAEKRSRQAKLALEHNEEAMSSLAVREKLKYEKQLLLYELQYETLTKQTTILKEKVTELQQTYHELQHKRFLLASRANAARMTKQLQHATGFMKTDEMERGLARAEDRVLLLEAEVKAEQYGAHHYPSYRSMDVEEEEVSREIEKLKSEVCGSNGPTEENIKEEYWNEQK